MLFAGGNVLIIYPMMSMRLIFFLLNFFKNKFEIQDATVLVNCPSSFRAENTDINKKSLKISKGNQNPYIEERATQWLKEKVQTDKQRYTKHTYKTKDRVTRTPLKTGVNSGSPEG